MVDRLCVCLTLSMRRYGVGEKRDDTFDYSHKEQDLESHLVLATNICCSFHSFRIVFMNHVVVIIVSVTIDWITTHMSCKVAIDATKEERVD